MDAPHSAQPRDPWRNLRVILYFNIPLIALLLLFDFWRAFVHRDGGAGCMDFVCTVTARYGDTLPVVRSFTVAAERRAEGVDIALVRELLFFNLIIWALYVGAATAAFSCAVPRLALRGIVNNPKYGRVFMPGFLFITLFVGFSFLNIAPIDETPRGWIRNLIYRHWAGVLSYNFTSLVSSFLAMALVVYISDMWAQWRRGMRKQKDRAPE